ncbi:MAG TPA: hypothetical protein VL992_00010 [Tepidisphaeraceae bacterium]|nr:hypothetical protein [Tepidisphaeraceae bacterium]
MRGTIDIVVGVVFIVGGLTGRLVLLGTHNGPLLALLGAVLIVIGLKRVGRNRY